MSKARGFTLIELLVVIAIMSTVLTLVAPLMFEQVDKSRASAEYIKVQQYVSDSTKLAFLKGQPITFTFNGKQLQRQIAEEIIVLDFDFVFFPKQQINVNANGFADKKVIDIMTGKKSQQIIITGA